MRAMDLLGINAGLGNADCGRLVFQAFDLDGGWLDYARPKTGVPRRVPLWPETVAALRESIAKRRSPSSPEHTSTVFITKRGEAWFKEETDHLGEPDVPATPAGRSPVRHRRPEDRNIALMQLDYRARRGALTPPKPPTRGLPRSWRHSVGRVARSETGHSAASR
jgi:integrase